MILPVAGGSSRSASRSTSRASSVGSRTTASTPPACRGDPAFRLGGLAADDQHPGAGAEHGAGERGCEVAAEQDQRCGRPLWTAGARLHGHVHGHPDGGGHTEHIVEQLGIRRHHQRATLSGHRSLLESRPATANPARRRTESVDPASVDDGTCLWKRIREPGCATTPRRQIPIAHPQWRDPSTSVDRALAPVQPGGDSRSARRTRRRTTEGSSTDGKAAEGSGAGTTG